MKKLLILCLSIAAPAAAQPWTLGSGWDLPMTAETAIVKQAIGRGVCGQAAVDFLRAQGFAAGVVPAGAASPPSTIVWYRKGDGCTGKFQYVTANGPYPEGWEIRFEPGSDATRWQFNPFAGPTYVPPPTPTPPPPSIPNVDLSAALAKLDALALQLARQHEEDTIGREAQTATLRAAIDEPGWIRKVVTNPYAQMIATAVATWLTARSTAK